MQELLCARKEPLNGSDLEMLEAIIGYHFRNRDLLSQAFIRETYANEFFSCEDNQILEFAGDRALEMVITRLILEKTSNVKEIKMGGQLVTICGEGKCTDIKKEVVKNSYLAERCRELKLSTYLVVGGAFDKPDQWDKKKPLSALMEAIIGAVAIDSNWSYPKLKKVIRVLLDLKIIDREVDKLQ